MNPKCTLCLKLWVFSDLRELFCGHIFCYNCLRKLGSQNNYIICPQCKKNHKLPKGGIAWLRKYKFEKLSETQSVNTHLCKKHERELCLYCKEHGSICVLCWEESHKSCSVMSNETLKEAKERIQNCLAQEKRHNKIIMRKIEQAELKALGNFYKQFEIIQKRVEHVIRKREEYFNEMLSKTNTDELYQLERNINNLDIQISDEILIDFEIQNSFLNQKEDNGKAFKMIDLSRNCIQDKQIEIINKEIQSTNGHLIKINLSQCNLGEHECIRIGILFQISNNIENVNLGWNSKMGNGLSSICNGLTQSKNSLKNFNLAWCNLNEEQCTWIGDLLKKCSKIETIRLEGNYKMGNGLADICTGLLNSLNSLKHINFRLCDLDEDQCINVGNLVKNCFVIESINLDWNKRMGNGLERFCIGLFYSQSTLKNIYLNQCNLDENQFKKIGNIMKYYSKLERIDLGFNLNMKNGIINFCQGLIESATNLKEINFENCNLNAKKCYWIGHLFSKSSNIENVNLKGNFELGDNGIKSICHGLQRSINSLKIINFEQCNLNEEQCNYIGNLFKYCSLIEAVNFKSNSKMEHGFQNVCKGLVKSSNSLKHINLECCQIDKESCINLGELLKNCSKIETINLKENRNISDAVEHICNGLLPSVKALKSINLNSCNFSKQQCFSIGKLLEKCSKIEKINLGYNSNMKTGVKNICNGLQQSSNTLKHISFEFCELDKNQANDIGNLLEICNKIETIDLKWNRNIGNGFKNIAEGLLIAVNTLQYINISLCNLSEEEIENIENLMKLKKQVF
ncbi:unnamed protein product [Dimorphilus gyrociliatus]|uniref:RING-type domain-containing protein n=1 Tax=Dimorphilus gyrociliatus TaxID=2664684 RepID=A0A7I8WET5_9ANNE|nr:unnamed protein product [Dimorphilus gyrociliatus]